MSGFAGMMVAARTATPLAAQAYTWDQVTILLHGDGANNGTVITDSSSYAQTVTRFGAVKTSTTQIKWGSASIFMDGASPYDYLTIPNPSNRFTFGSGDFTVEGWCYPTSFAKAQILTSMWFPGNAAQCSWGVQIGTNGKFNGTFNASTTTFELTSQAQVGSFNLNAWNHWACSRIGNVFSCYINGTRAGTGPIVGTNTTSTAALYVGYRESNNNFTGYMDDFRIIKGVGLYSGATITVPTAVFPNS